MDLGWRLHWCASPAALQSNDLIQLCVQAVGSSFTTSTKVVVTSVPSEV